MKLLKTNNTDTENYCCTQFNFKLPSNLVSSRSRKHEVKYRRALITYSVNFYLCNLCLFSWSFPFSLFVVIFYHDRRMKIEDKWSSCNSVAMVVDFSCSKPGFQFRCHAYESVAAAAGHPAVTAPVHQIIPLHAWGRPRLGIARH